MPTISLILTYIAALSGMLMDRATSPNSVRVLVPVLLGCHWFLALPPGHALFLYYCNNK